MMIDWLNMGFGALIGAGGLAISGLPVLISGIFFLAKMRHGQMQLSNDQKQIKADLHASMRSTRFTRKKVNKICRVQDEMQEALARAISHAPICDAKHEAMAERVAKLEAERLEAGKTARGKAD